MGILIHALYTDTKDILPQNHLTSTHSLSRKPINMTHSSASFDLPQLERLFNEKFGEQIDNSPVSFHAPGRVNLIGEHTDYTGGMVFPCAIDRGTLLLIRRNNTNQFRFASTNFDFSTELPAAEISKAQGDSWVNYPLGVIDQFKKRGINLDGLDCLYSGNVPNGAGLSSSASIEVVTAFAINELFNASLDNIELVKISQAAENEFVGMQCGIMDQFAVAMGKQNHALMLNCQTLHYRHVPLNLDDHAIVLINTNQRRELNESAYNDRVAECQRALTIVQQRVDVNSLGELRMEDFETTEDLFTDDPLAYRRARHVCSENTRVTAAVDALENNDLNAFGAMMKQSHQSLRDDFEVSSKPLDTLVDLASKHPGVLGARLTGAGFGGCTVNLMHQDALATFENAVANDYQQATGLTADFYIIKPSDGVGEMTS